MKNPCLSAVTSVFRAAGVPFCVEHGGKHFKVRFGVGFKRSQVVPVSPGDNRSWKNDRARARRFVRELEGGR